ncbi:BRO-N domain-containing protein [Desulfovibrio piger]|uniref:BRO-N domain-containing protein n=1 Tax=Desulfovibrio piger TaxID=901 RepID=UPI003F107BB6
MTQALIFNEITLSPVTYQNSLWIRATELARALGYSDTRKISHLYERNADEFTPEMTQVIEITDVPEMGTLENLRRKARIFSLRGCHLVAMFARTPVAKAFRRWVLDVLDKLDAEQHAASPSPTPDDFTGTLSPLSKRTDPERKQLTAIINTWVGMAPIHYASARAQVNAHFGVTGVDKLTVEQVKEAIQWVQAKIDALPAPAPATALPASPSSPTDDAEGHLAAIREHIRHIHRHEEALFLLARRALPAARKPQDMYSPARRTGLSAFQSMEDCAGALDYSLRALESAARTMLALGR